MQFMWVQSKNPSLFLRQSLLYLRLAFAMLTLLFDLPRIIGLYIILALCNAGVGTRGFTYVRSAFHSLCSKTFF